MRKVTVILTMCVLAVVIMAATAVFAAPEDSNSGRRAMGRQGNSLNNRTAEAGDRQERMAQMMKQQLGFSDEEWTVIGPRLTKVMTLSRQSQTRMMGGPGSRPGGRERGGQRPGGQDSDQARPERRRPQETNDSEVQKAVEALNTVLENTKSTTDEIKAKLTTLRAAKEKAKQQLAQAQQELKEVLTLRQEAKLVTLGLLN